MRWLRRQSRCILALASSYILGHDAVLAMLGYVNRRWLGGRIKTVFMYYPASQAYADAVCYRWHQRRFGWRPGLVGVFLQNGQVGLSFAIPNTESDFKEAANAARVDGLMRQMDTIRRRVGAAHKRFAGILPSIFVNRGIADQDIGVQRTLTARAVLAALDDVIGRHHLPADVPVLILGGRGFIAREVLELSAGRNMLSIDAGQLAEFRAMIRPMRGHPLIIVNLTKSGALAEYIAYLWPGSIVLNEVYPEPSTHEIAAMQSLGNACYHIAGIRASCWPAFPRAYRGGIPCCASLPLGEHERVEVVVIALAGGRPARPPAKAPQDSVAAVS